MAEVVIVGLATGLATGEGEAAGVVWLEGVQGLGQPVPGLQELRQYAPPLGLDDVDDDGNCQEHDERDAHDTQDQWAAWRKE